MLTAQTLVDRLIQSRLARPDQIVGCSTADLAAIERVNDVTLPAAYRQFLQAVGRGAGRYLNDITAFFPAIVRLTPEVRGRFEGTFKLPPKAFVFTQRLGEAFTYFEADGRSDDPPVYGWHEDLDSPELAFPSIWALFEQELAECARR